VKKLGESTSKALDIATEDVDLSGVEVTDGETQPDVVTEEIDDAPVVKYVQKIMLDAINAGLPTSTSSPTRSSTASATARTASSTTSRSRRSPSRRRSPRASRWCPGSTSRKARAPGRAHEDRALQDPRHRLPRLHPADALRREDLHANPRSLERHARDRSPRLRAGAEGVAHARDPATLRHGAGDGADGLREDRLALHLPQHPQQAGHQHLDRRDPAEINLPASTR